jgi:hypothetical protein
MAPDLTVREGGTFCPSSLLVFYIPPCRKTFPEFSGALPCVKNSVRIRDILVRIRIRIPGSVHVTNGSGSNRLLSSLVLRLQKKYLFSYFFLITCPQAHHLQSKKFNFLLKFCVKILFSRHYFNTFMRKGKDPDPDLESEPDPYPYIWLMDPDPDPGGPKTCGSGSPTLEKKEIMWAGRDLPRGLRSTDPVLYA